MKFTMRLFRHPNGYYYAELERNRRRSLGTRDKNLARQIYRKLKAEFLLNKVAFLEGRYKEHRTLGQFQEEYLDWVYQARAENTYIGARSAFRRLALHLSPDTPLHNISRRQLKQIQAAMLQKVKPSSVNARFRHYRAAFAKAQAWEYLRLNPCRGLKPLPEPETLPHFLTLEDLARILNAETNPRYLTLWLLCLQNGLRRKEALALTWADIETNRAYIRQSKNRRPRVAWISPELQTLLQSLGPGVGKIFPWGPRQTSRRFSQLCAGLGIKARLHDLRHSYGSYGAMAGIDTLTLKNLMGHQDIRSTLIYARLSPDHLSGAQAKLVNALNMRQLTPEK